MRAPKLIALIVIAGCTDWPVVDTPRSEGAWPSLVPLSTISSSSNTAAETEANEELIARAASLRARAALMRRPVNADGALEQLRERLAR